MHASHVLFRYSPLSIKPAGPESTRHFVGTATASAASNLPLSSSRREAPCMFHGRSRLSFPGRCTGSIMGSGRICQSRSRLTELMSKDSCRLPKAFYTVPPRDLLTGSSVSSPLPDDIPPVSWTGLLPQAPGLALAGLKDVLTTSRK